MREVNMYLNNIKSVLKAIFLAAFVSAFINPAAGLEIVDFFSDFTSSDVTINSSQALQGRAVFELFNEGNLVESHDVPFNIKAGEPATKVIVWQKKPQQDYYTAKVSIFDDSKLLDSKTYQVSYGTVSLPGFHVVDFSPSNSGAQLLLRPFSPSVADIKIEMLDNNDIVYTETRKDVSLLMNAEIKTTWPFLLTNDKEYTVRAKIFTHRLYASPLINTYIAYFTAADDVEILRDDVEVDEYGASVTIRGKSRVPFDGSIVVNARNRATGEIQTFNQRVEEILVSGKEDTAGVVWGGLAPGTYYIEILAVNQDNKTLDRYETILRIPEYASATETPPAKSTPGFIALISILMVLAASRWLKRKGG
ncbi:MAG: hypothetical protein M5U10_15450 [Candidatus Methanoperedens sp.]|nr:hypothetical protein [Candidatus Methanoperedens nitroreducens]MDJ1423293.1 hypothetical protein [Candidatus Methanoperedens sp.]